MYVEIWLRWQVVAAYVLTSRDGMRIRWFTVTVRGATQRCIKVYPETDGDVILFIFLILSLVLYTQNATNVRQENQFFFQFHFIKLFIYFSKLFGLPIHLSFMTVILEIFEFILNYLFFVMFAYMCLVIIPNKYRILNFYFYQFFDSELI